MINMGNSYLVKTSKKDGWTVTTADGSLSAQFEHTILVTADGAEILTKV
ncbi:MAG: type I methionyl aminopeptidase, partial [Candidatus Cloacimonadota bacterium]